MSIIKKLNLIKSFEINLEYIMVILNSDLYRVRAALPCIAQASTSLQFISVFSRQSQGETIQEARPPGIEPRTYGLEVRCSIQLSYGRVVVIIDILMSYFNRKAF